MWIMKIWPFSMFQKPDISQMPFVCIGKNGAYGLNPANIEVSQNIFRSLREIEKMPIQHKKKNSFKD